MTKYFKSFFMVMIIIWLHFVWVSADIEEIACIIYEKIAHMFSLILMKMCRTQLVKLSLFFWTNTGDFVTFSKTSLLFCWLEQHLLTYNIKTYFIFYLETNLTKSIIEHKLPRRIQIIQSVQSLLDS